MDVTNMTELPSPQQLCNKIIIKAKKFLHGGQPTTVSPTFDGAKMEEGSIDAADVAGNKLNILQTDVRDF